MDANNLAGSRKPGFVEVELTSATVARQGCSRLIEGNDSITWKPFEVGVDFHNLFPGVTHSIQRKRNMIPKGSLRGNQKLGWRLAREVTHSRKLGSVTP